MGYNFEKYTNMYEFPVYLQGIEKELKIRPLTTKDIKRILVYENETDIIKLEEVIDILFDNAIIGDFNTDDLYIQDRYTLLLELRKITKGTKYSYTTECYKCNGDIIVNVDFDNIKIREKNITDNIVPILDGVLKLELNFITRGEQKEAYAFLENRQLTSTEQMIDMVLLNLAQSIKSIETKDGIKDIDIPLKNRMEFVENLPRKELKEIRDWYEKNEFGADLKIVEVCPHCGAKKENIIEITNFFD